MRHAVLALLADQPAHGYEIKRGLEERFGIVVAPLNAGQVYTTLQRLQRDALVADDAVAQTGRPDKRVYRLTDAGRDALFEWLGAPSAPTRLRDDFFMKLVFAHSMRLADPAELIERQRAAYLRSLGELERVLANDPAVDGTTALVVEGAALHLEADLKWLDRCEEMLIS
jgi:DNA-binding PadR family transcriptional regulator